MTRSYGMAAGYLYAVTPINQQLFSCPTQIIHISTYSEREVGQQDFKSPSRRYSNPPISSHYPRVQALYLSNTGTRKGTISQTKCLP